MELVIQYSTGDLFSYPFLAGVWGTVPQWCLVVGAAITSGFSFLAYREQRSINEALLIEQAIKIRPVFDVKYISYSSNGDDTPFFLIYLTNQTPLNARKIKIYSDPDNKEIYKASFVRTGAEIKILFSAFDTDWDNNRNQEGLLLFNDIIIEFEDETGRKYSQEIKKNLYEEDNREIDISFPERLK